MHNGSTIKMRLTRKNMHVIQGGWDEWSKNPWWKIRIDIPELHLESPLVMTVDYAQFLINKIAKDYETCPHCGKKV